MFKQWIIKLATRWQKLEYERYQPVPTENGKYDPASSRSTRIVSHNYHDTSVINFKIYGANGGKIIETSRYDAQLADERITLYVIDESADFTESLSKIVTMEYIRR